MLVLSRKLGESIEIGDSKILVRVLAIKRSKVQLGVDAPSEIAIHRSEMRQPDTDSSESGTGTARPDPQAPSQARSPQSSGKREWRPPAAKGSVDIPHPDFSRTRIGSARKSAPRKADSGNVRDAAERTPCQPPDQRVGVETDRRLGESLLDDLAKIQVEIDALASLIPECDQALAQRVAAEAAERLAAVERSVQRACRGGSEQPIAKFLGVRSRELLRTRRDHGSCEDREANRSAGDSTDQQGHSKNGSSIIRESNPPFTLSTSDCPLGSAS